MNDLEIIFAVVILVTDVTAQTGPTHCSYSDGVYECNYYQMTSVTDRPLYFSDFSTQPQQIVLNADGFLPYFGDARIFDANFSTSSSMDVSLFDVNFPARLEINCGWSGSAYIDVWAFTDVEYVQHFKIKNCDILYIGLDTFADFIELDYLGIEGGSIDTIEPLSMAGLTVEKLTSATHQFPRLQGKLEVVNAKFTYGFVSSGLLTFFTNVTSVTLKNAGISFLTSDLFKYNPHIRLLDLSDNLFSKIPAGCFDHQHGISELTLYNIEWECTCDNLWWIQHIVSGNITAHSDMMCNNQQGTTLLKYYFENCAAVEPCTGKTGFPIGDKCQSVTSIVAVCLSIFSVIATSASLVLAIINKSNAQEENDPVVLDRLKRRARERWRKAARHIIYYRRTGKPLFGLESEGSRTMSIPDETKSHNQSSGFNSLGRSSDCDSYITDSYFAPSDAGDSSYAEFPSSDYSDRPLGWKYR